MGEKEGVVIDVKGEREAVGEEDAGEKIEVGEERFTWVKPGTRIEACGIVEDVEEGLLLELARQPGVRRGVVLPERAEVAGLPAADGPGGLFIAGVRGKVAGDGPAADTGAVGLEIEPAQQLTGDGAVGGARRGGQQAGGESDGLRRPVWMMIATRSAGLPGVRLPASAGPQIPGAKLVNPRASEAEFERESGGGKPARAQFGEEVADQVRRQAAKQLRFFIARVLAGGWILRIPADAGQGLAGRPPAEEQTARLAVYLAGVSAQVASPQSPILRTSKVTLPPAPMPRQPHFLTIPHFSAFDRTDPSGFDRTTTPDR